MDIRTAEAFWGSAGGVLRASIYHQSSLGSFLGHVRMRDGDIKSEEFHKILFFEVTLSEVDR